MDSRTHLSICHTVPQNCTLVRRVRSRRRRVLSRVGRTTRKRPRPIGPRLAKVLLAQRREPLLLGDSVDVRAQYEPHQVEERHPRALGQELLRKRQADGRCHPADLHDLPEAHVHRRPHLVVCPGAGDNGHGAEVNGVLDGCDLDWERWVS